MKRALLAGALAVGLGAMALTRGAPPAPAPPAQATATSPPPATPPPLPPLLRNPFEFASRPQEPPPRPSPPTGLTRSSEPQPSPVRLVGFVRRADGLKAVLVLDGEAVLLSLGETESGYTLVSIDEADGVRLSAPDGSEIGLAVPE